MNYQKFWNFETMKNKIIGLLLLILIFSSCGIMRPKWKSVILRSENVQIADLLGIKHDALKKQKSKPIYQFSPSELDLYLGYLQSVEPDLRKRVQHLARKCLGQPYQIFLLGEFPYEIYDPDPLFSLEKGDCVIFSEHIYAMALSYDWKSFLTFFKTFLFILCTIIL